MHFIRILGAYRAFRISVFKIFRTYFLLVTTMMYFFVRGRLQYLSVKTVSSYAVGVVCLTRTHCLPNHSYQVSFVTDVHARCLPCLRVRFHLARQQRRCCQVYRYKIIRLCWRALHCFQVSLNKRVSFFLNFSSLGQKRSIRLPLTLQIVGLLTNGSFFLRTNR